MELQNINWNELNHAYGKAEDILEVLQEISSYPEPKQEDDDPYYYLWSALCHQGDVYSASYAAVPYLVNLIEKSPTQSPYDLFLLPISIEIARANGSGPDIDETLKENYFAALKQLPILAANIKTNDEVYIRVLSATFAISSGHTSLAESILELWPEVLEDLNKWLLER